MPAPSAHHQTITFLRERLAEVGIHPDSRRGQNFLIDINLVRLLVDSAGITGSDVVLEVGSGTGSLTNLLAEQAAQVISVEVDPALAQLSRESFTAPGKVTLIEADALRNKNHFRDEVLEAVAEALAVDPARRLKLAANLPYSVATPVISNLLALESPPVSMTVTIQKELAERIVARPSTKDYSALSVWVQSQCRAEIIRVLPPSVFWPRPKVHSAIVHLEVDPALRSRIADLDFFHNLVRALFLHRRKFLRSVLASAMKGRLDKRQVDEILAELGHASNARAEELDVPAMIALTDAVQKSLEGSDATR